MFLYDINYFKFYIAYGDMFLDLKYEDDEFFDVIVFNLFYFIKWVGDSNFILINDERFSLVGVLAFKNVVDFVFIMYMFFYLFNSGMVVIVEFFGVFYRGNVEVKIREYLVKENVIDCVIVLLDNFFFGMSIVICILVFKKNK